MMTFAELIGIKCSTTGSGSGPDQSSLSTTCETADRRSGHAGSGNGQFIAVLSPKASLMPPTRSRLVRG
jgi:hypothetical protein